MSCTDSGGTYDEPWDLRATRLGLESRFRTGASHLNTDVSTSAGALSPLSPPVGDSQHFDPRSPLEYDEPWDRRTKNVQRNLITAKALDMFDICICSYLISIIYLWLTVGSRK